MWLRAQQLRLSFSQPPVVHSGEMKWQGTLRQFSRLPQGTSQRGVVSLKHNQARFGGQPDHGYRPASAIGAASALDQFTESQHHSFLIVLHDGRIRRANGSPLLGIPPMRDSCQY
jgi:hypothetical protein